MNFNFYRKFTSNMLLSIIIIFTVMNIILACKSTKPIDQKRHTAAIVFLKLRSQAPTRCQYINRSFDKLIGSWSVVIRLIDSKSKLETRCAQFMVTSTSRNHFEANLIYIGAKGSIEGFILTGVYVNETTVNIPEYQQWITGNHYWINPFHVQMAICDNSSLVFMEPIYYRGGGMLLARRKPKNIFALQKRFSSFDEDRGKEKSVQVSFNCQITKYE